MMDEEFQKLVEIKLDGVRVKESDAESVDAFFGNEDFSEYEDFFI